MKLPSNWSEITAETYVNFLASFDILEQISHLSGLPLGSNEVMNLSSDEVRKIKKGLAFMQELPLVADSHFNGCSKKPMNKMNVWTWRDFDFYGSDWKENILRLIRLAYGNLDDDLSEFKDFPMSCFPINDWMEFKALCFDKFKIGEKDDSYSEIAELEKSNHFLDQMRLEKLKKEQKINNVLLWEKTMLAICNNSALEAYNTQYLEVIYIFKIISIRNLQD